MILDTKNERIDQVDLSHKEYKFLASLANNELVKSEDMLEFIFGRRVDTRLKISKNLSVIKNRLQKKKTLDITVRRCIGYKLNNIIEIV